MQFWLKQRKGSNLVYSFLKHSFSYRYCMSHDISISLLKTFIIFLVKLSRKGKPFIYLFIYLFINLGQSYMTIFQLLGSTLQEL
jgi:hypothetical protein